MQEFDHVNLELCQNLVADFDLYLWGQKESHTLLAARRARNSEIRLPSFLMGGRNGVGGEEGGEGFKVIYQPCLLHC